MTVKDFLFGPHTGWVALGLFVAGLYGFAVRMTHRRATSGAPRTRTGEFNRVGRENGTERRSTVEMRPLADPTRRSTVEMRPLADPTRRSTVETRTLADPTRRSTVETRTLADPTRRSTTESRPASPLGPPGGRSG